MEQVIINITDEFEEVTITVVDNFSQAEVLNKKLAGLEAYPSRELPTALDTILIFCKKVLKYLSDLGSAAYTNSDAYDPAGTGAGMVASHESLFNHSNIHAPGSDAETATTIANIVIGVSEDTITGDDYIPFHQKLSSALKRISYSAFLTLLNSIYSLVGHNHTGVYEPALGFTPENAANKNQNNGYCPLDSGGKVPGANLPYNLMELQGSWDAMRNDPELSDGMMTFDCGAVFECVEPGTVNFGNGNITFKMGDWAVYAENRVWYKSLNSNEVTSVNSQTGTVVLDADDISDSATTKKFTNDTEKGTWNGKAEGNHNHSGTYTDFNITINTSTDSYVLALTDANTLRRMNKSTANNLTIPLNSSVPFPIGTRILTESIGVGQTTFVATGGVTINSCGSRLKIAAQYCGAMLIKTDTDTWWLSGDLIL